jgi:hypothetical protein
MLGEIGFERHNPDHCWSEHSVPEQHHQEQ